MYKCTAQLVTIYGRKLFFSTPDNPLLAHQEMVSDVMYEPPTRNIISITAAIINATDNGNLATKIIITQEEGYID